MTTVLLDTNIVSYLFKRNSRAALYAPHLLDCELAIAMMTVAESICVGNGPTFVQHVVKPVFRVGVR